MNKRGLSAVVTTLMIILLALVAVGVLWLVVGNLISEESEIFEAKSKLFFEQVNIKSVKIDSGDELSLVVSLQKLGGSSNLKSVKIITSSSTRNRYNLSCGSFWKYACMP